MRISREQKGTGFLLLVLGVIVVFSSAVAISLWSDATADLLKEDQVTRVLFVMESEDGSALSTNVFMYYSPLRKGVIINIPGNTGAIYKSLNRVDRIDQIYAEKGVDTYKSEIEKMCGVTIPFYVVIGLDNLTEMTDILGGLKMLVPEPVDAVSPEGERWLLPSGSVLLDGEKIAAYMMYVLENETEADVAGRRLSVLVSFMEALNQNSGGMLTKKNFKFLRSKIGCNLDEEMTRKLFQQMAAVDADRILSQTITGVNRLVDGKLLLLPFYDGELVKDVVKQATNLLLAENGTMTGRVYVLEIKNGTTVTGLAHNTAALLRSAGYDVLTTLNADRNDVEKTAIINHIGNAEAAKNLGDFIHCKNIIEETVNLDRSADSFESGADVDFTIVLGRDFDGRYVH